MAFTGLYVSIHNTWKWASDYYGLVVLVTVPEKDRSYNPYSKSFFWVSQEAAISLIKNYEYPYDNCSKETEKLFNCEHPKIEYAVRYIGIVDKSIDPLIISVIEHLIQRGEPIDAYTSEGYTALQSAILGNSPKLVKLLLESGADPYIPIKSKNKMNGKNSIEFVEFLLSENKKEFSELAKVFYEKMPNKSLKNEDALKRAP